MLKRSKNSPLYVIALGTPIPCWTHPVLEQSLASHLPRIKELIIGRGFNAKEPAGSFAAATYKPIPPWSCTGLVQLLGQPSTSAMERLEMSLDLAFPDIIHSATQLLPDGLLMRSSSLKHLALEGCAIDWGLLPAFQSLKSFKMSRIPSFFEPSMAQLLSFLSHIPLLETISVSPIRREELTLHDVGLIQLRCLKHLTFSCESLPVITSFFDYVALPKEGLTLDVVSVIPWQNASHQPLLAAIQILMRKLDDATAGSVSKLTLARWGFQCWKAKQEQPSQELPVITLELDNLASFTDLGSSLNVAVIQALRLDQLLCLVVSSPCNSAVWTLLGNLPCVKELTVHLNQSTVIGALHCGVLAEESQRNVPTPLHSKFPALTALTIVNWWSFAGFSLERLLECVKSRSEARLPLKRLMIQQCEDVDDKDLVRLEAIIDEVHWDGVGHVHDEGSSDSGEDL
ncbi:hypothetical protein H0H92_001762 [Tricholoma furcatifolium]|nr:hypothetical protein H0H92_001762 [Tricholoma furcatifolium]